MRIYMYAFFCCPSTAYKFRLFCIPIIYVNAFYGVFDGSTGFYTPKEQKRLPGPFLPVWCDSVILYKFPLHLLYTLYHIILSMSSIAIFSGRYSPANISPNTDGKPSSTHQHSNTCQLVKILTSSPTARNTRPPPGHTTRKQERFP